MTLSKLVRAQEGVPTLQSGLPAKKIGLDWPKKRLAKITPKIAGSALSGDWTAATSATNHSGSIKWPSAKLSGLKTRFLHHKVAPRPQIRPELAKKRTAKITANIARSALSGYPTGITSVTNRSAFIERHYVELSSLKMGLLHHEVTPYPQIWPELAKRSQAKIVPKTARSTLLRDPTALTLLTNHSIFMK